MNLHEYQGKQLFAEYGLPVSKGYACATPEEAAAAADKIGGAQWVVKAQVHAGGRGKAGGVKLVTTKDEIRDFAAKRLADFKVPRKVLILSEIPKGATGKIQRIGLAQKLGLS